MTWPRDAFVAAVWESTCLKPLERLVALAYADHARDGETAWVTYPRLMERTGLSRDALARALNGLRAQGWLEVHEPARQQRAARYWLRIPEDSQQSVSRTAGHPQESVFRTAEDPSGLPHGPLAQASSPSPDTSSPRGGPDSSSHHSSHQTSDDEERARQAVAALVDRHRLDPQVATAAVAGMLAWSSKAAEPIVNITAFARSRSLDEIHRFAASRAPGDAIVHRPRAEARDVVIEVCEHGERGGMLVLGRGSSASRLCTKCEVERPADGSEPQPVGAAS